MKNYITGTSIPNLDLNGLMNRKILIPSYTVVERYSQYKKAILKQKYSKENNKLSEIRDSILPKLMSGEIEV